MEDHHNEADSPQYNDAPEGSSIRQDGNMSVARRKEANRLAANRSRARRAERLMALEVAAQALAEENLGLKEQIAKIVAGRQNLDPSRTVFEALISGQENWEVDGLFGELSNAQSSAVRADQMEQDRLGDLANAAAGAEAPPAPAPAAASSSSTLPASASSGLHMHLNADMEYNLRQEILNKRAELAMLPGPSSSQPFNLPPEQATLAETQDAINQVNARTNVLRTVVVAMKADMEALEKERRALREALLEIEGGTQRDEVENVLKSVRAHVVDHLGGATDNIALPAPANASVNAAGPSTTPPPAAARRTRRTRTAAVNEREPVAGPGPSTRQAAVRSASRTQAQLEDDGDVEMEQEQPLDQAAEEQENEMVIDPTLEQAEPEVVEEGLPAEDEHHHVEHDHSEHDAFLLSTLAHQHEQHNHELDAATFASLLPDSEVGMQHRDSVPPEHNTVAPDDFPQAGEGDEMQYENEQLVENGSKRQTPAGNCEICGRKETSVWRKLVHEGIEKRVCNACGLYFQKFGKVRPPNLWGDGRSVKKRRVPEPMSDGTPRSKRGRPPGSTKKTAQARALEFEQRRQAAEAAAAGVDVGMEIEQQLGDVFAQHAQAQAHLHSGQHEDGQGDEEEEPSAGMGIGHELGVEGLGVS